MLLGLVRDRGALVMSFLLPVVFFFIFSMIFASAGGEELRLSVAMADEVDSETSKRLLYALSEDTALRRTGSQDLTAQEVRELVRRGTADIGIIVRDGGRPLEALTGLGPAPLILVSDPARGVAVPMLAGQIQKAYFAALPDVALGSVVSILEESFLELNEQQQMQLQIGFARLRENAKQGRETGWRLQELFERESIVGQTAAVNHVAYYAGAVAVLFLLFTSVNGAITLLEERESGILERILAGPGSTRVLVNGKFLYLLLQGFLQLGVIYLVAWLVYGVDLPGNFIPWALTSVAASAAAAGMSLALATACRSRRQAQTLSTLVILVLSALGGSMVPRFLMPQLLQDLGWLTPNTWALEAYTAIFWKGEPMQALWLPWGLLVITAGVGLLLAQRFTRRLEIL
jgi:ABC-2 type transport system permease protein